MEKKIRVYQLARELKIESQALVDKIRAMGIEVSSYQSSLSDHDHQKIRTKLQTKSQDSSNRRTVIRRRKKITETPTDTGDSSDDDDTNTKTTNNELDSQKSDDSPAENDDQDGEKSQQPQTQKQSDNKFASPADEMTSDSTADQLSPEANDDQQPSLDQNNDATAEKQRFSVMAQQLAKQRDSKKSSTDKNRKINYAKVVRKATPDDSSGSLKKAPDTKSVTKSSQPETSTAPSLRFKEHRGSKSVKTDDLKDSPLRKPVVKKGKRSQFNPRRLLLNVDQEEPLRTLRKKTVYSPKGTKNRDHRRRKDLKKTQITTPKASRRIIEMTSDSLSVGELAHQLSLKASELIQHLMKDGIMATVNEELDKDTITIVASHFNFEVKVTTKTVDELLTRGTPDPNSFKPRPPVVTLMGHVDHGKTSILDVIRQTATRDIEEGGITQHIGAYVVDHNSHKITFLDTPGHAAFSHMRNRGVQVTDIVVLVVAADDGVMPQTIEALSHAKNAEVPVIVALNKMDKPDINLDRIYSELAKHGIQSEEWGGDHQFIKLSAAKKTGIEDLLEAAILQSELLELKASHSIQARGVIIEAHMDVGRGPVATVMVSEGVFRVGDEIVAGTTYGRMRAMRNDLGQRVKEVYPSTPVEIEGLDKLPMVGDIVDWASSRDVAQAVASQRLTDISRKASGSTTISTLEDLVAKVDAEKILSVPFIIKADTQGSMQAASEALITIKSDKIKAKIVHQGVGAINASDVSLAEVSGAVIMGFNVRAMRTVAEDSEKNGVIIKYFSVIYELIDMAEALLAGSLPPIQNEMIIGKAEVKKTISVPKVGVVAGSHVTEGRVTRNCRLRLIRDNVVIHSGRMGSLRRFKDDVKEVTSGYECGITFENHKDVRDGDILEAFEIEEVKATL
ncbi:MAG: translation initiation factor IF-2 [Proteobacteria bacterium]|nr:translation initiation factor IF-2 [Pseudomonadota bacterium]